MIKLRFHGRTCHTALGRGHEFDGKPETFLNLFTPVKSG